jgi:aromatic ring-opening dioxygenase LigB subunit
LEIKLKNSDAKRNKNIKNQNSEINGKKELNILLSPKNTWNRDEIKVIVEKKETAFFALFTLSGMESAGIIIGTISFRI